MNARIGTMVTAARGGTVLHVEESHFDGEVAPTGYDNVAAILHADGTVGLYGHFTHEGVLVEPAQIVRAGDTLGHSGNTGNTGNIAHLHFSVHACDPVVHGSAACASLPVTYRNTQTNAQGLESGGNYPAYPFVPSSQGSTRKAAL